jgi:putative modified peptide
MSNHLPADIAEKLLDHLSTDDDFRDLFEKNARAALKKIGYETPEADRDWKGRDPVLSVQHLKGGLASKEKIAADRSSLLAAYKNVGAAAPARSVSSGASPAALPFGPFVMCCDD